MPKHGARTLLEMSLSASVRHVRSIYDIGPIPYALISPVLARVTLPEQLHTLETNSPQIVGHTADLWRKMIERDIPRGLESLAQFNEGRGAPNDPNNWYKLYRKLKRDAERKQQENLAALQGRLQSTTGVRGGSVAAEVDGGGNEGGMMFRKTAPPRPSDMRGRSGGTYTPVHRKGFFDKIKHERTKEALVKQHGQSRMPLPKWQAKLQVSKAPVDMVMDIKDQRDREREGKMVRAPKRRGASKPLFAPERAEKKITVEGKGDGYDLIGDREERLRALKAGKSTIKDKPAETARGLTEDFLEDDDDLFGEKDETDSGDTMGASALKPPAVQDKRSSSPLKHSPLPQMIIKRKAADSLFHSPKRVAR